MLKYQNSKQSKKIVNVESKGLRVKWVFNVPKGNSSWARDNHIYTEKISAYTKYQLNRILAYLFHSIKQPFPELSTLDKIVDSQSIKWKRLFLVRWLYPHIFCEDNRRFKNVKLFYKNIFIFTPTHMHKIF